MIGKKNSVLCAAIVSTFFGVTAQASVDEITKALTEGKAYGDLRLRYETVAQDNALSDASGLTLRTRLGYKTGAISGFSSTIEFEDSRTIAGVDEYELPGPARDADYLVNNKSVIADPETTELDQAFLQYSSETFSAKVGSQVITLDNHRYVGHVGWRQDRQTFDAATLSFRPEGKVSIDFAYITERNRIFGTESDIKAKDKIFNASYKTPFGKATLYGYFLSQDNDVKLDIDTRGVRFVGKQALEELDLLYTLEYASQDRKNAAGKQDTDYKLLELGASVSGITTKLGYESLGSDEGTYGFSTPLATGHKFNGWSDQFLGTPSVGLDDLYVSVSGKLAGGKWVLAYHDFSANQSSGSVDDLGSEIDILYAKSFAKNYSAGLKYAAYSAGDQAAGKVDTDKMWVWLGAKF
jgi:Alginate export